MWGARAFNAYWYSGYWFGAGPSGSGGGPAPGGGSGTGSSTGRRIRRSGY